MMNTGAILWSFRGPFGIPVQISASAVMLGVFIVLLSGGHLGTSLGRLAMIYGAILLHEMGHAWACEVQGVPVRRIVLHGFGGLCEPARSASRHQSELIVAMGPLVNLVLWALCGLAVVMLSPDLSQTGYGMAGPARGVEWPVWLSYVARFGQLNLWFFLFNMLPVQPLDGGKLFHLGMLRLMPARRAGQVTGWVGLVFAVLWLPAALYMFLVLGWVLFFFPSIRQQWNLARSGA